MALVNPNQPIHPKFHERISVKVEGQLPQFVKEDHSTFVAFMEAYYEYMEQQGKPYEIIGSLDNYANVDKTVDDFLQYFKKQFGEDIPEAVFANANKPFVLKHLRDFYRTKGSVKSFEFLFRLLYKEEITIEFPGKNILRTSDGKYDENKFIRVIDSSGDISNIIGKQITGQTSGSVAVVERIITELIGRYCVSTIFLSGVEGTFLAEENITDGVYSFEVGSMIVDTTITNPGCSYSIGDIVSIVGGGIGSGGFIRVKEIHTGSFKEFTISNGGTGYKNDERLNIDNTNKLVIDGRSASIFVKEVDVNGTILNIEIENSGSGYIGLPTISGGSGTGADISFLINTSGIGGIKSVDIISTGYGYKPAPTLDLTSSGFGDAQIDAIIGGYDNTPEFTFINTDGFLSSDKYIQDSFFYQLFSYEITSTHNITQWRDIVKRVVHPAGLALFGRYQFLSHLETKLSITNIVPDTQDRFTIIFHDGSIKPAFILDLTLETCDDQQDIRKYREGDDYGIFDLTDLLEDYQPSPETLNTAFTTDENYQPISETLNTAFTTEETFGSLWEPASAVLPTTDGCPGDEGFEFNVGICSPTDFGFITDNETDSNVLNLEAEDYNLITQDYFIFLPTMCQIYEQDLRIQELNKVCGYEDYFFTYLEAGEVSGDTRESHVDNGFINAVATSSEDYEWVFKNQRSFTQLRLGPLRRTIDRQKFNSQGGYGQGINTVNGIEKIAVFELGSGYTAVPTVTISPPISGTTATATAIISGGTVTSITINNIGSGYITVPSITIEPPVSGTTATATAVFQRTSSASLSDYANEQISEYVFFQGLKTNSVMNSMITQYTTGFENRGNINVALPY